MFTYLGAAMAATKDNSGSGAHDDLFNDDSKNPTVD